MARKLERAAKPFGRKSRPVLPAMELIAVVAAAHPGPGDRYNLRQPDSVIRRYLKAARKSKALLILDIQPGRSDFFTETKRLRKWLKEPDVGLALDPEWRMKPGEVPGNVIGSVGAREVNATTAWLDQLVQRHNLPQKLLLIHQFTDDMIPESELKERKGLAYVLNVDGFGTQGLKVGQVQGVRQAGHGLPARLQALLPGGPGDHVAAAGDAAYATAGRRASTSERDRPFGRADQDGGSIQRAPCPHSVPRSDEHEGDGVMRRVWTALCAGVLAVLVAAPPASATGWGRDFKIEEATIADIQKAILDAQDHDDRARRGCIWSASRPTTAPA